MNKDQVFVNKKDEVEFFVLVDKEPSIDSICSAVAYTHFLNKQHMNSTFYIEEPLSAVQEKIFEFTSVQSPELLSKEFRFTNQKCIYINISSFQKLHPNITPEHVEGIIANEKPQYFEHFEEQIPLKHIEFVNSISTLITEKFKYSNTQPTSQIASILLLGIILSLNGLEESQTSNRDFVAIEYLEQFATIRRDQINALVNQL